VRTPFLGESKSATPDEERSEGSVFAFSTFRALWRVVLIFAFSRSLGLLREVGTAAFFGTTAVADRIGTAFIISSVATIVVSEAVGASAFRKLSRDRASIASLHAWAKRSMPVAISAYAILGVPLAAFMTSGDRGSHWEGPLLVIALTPCVATSMLAAVGGALLTLEGRIGRVTASQACWSGGSLLGVAVIAAGVHSPLPLVLGWSVGNIAGLLVIESAVDIQGPTMIINGIALLRPSIAVTFAYTLIAFQSITDRIIASRLQTGAIAALGYADRIHLIPVGFVLAVYGPAILGDLMNRDRLASVNISQSALHLERLARIATPAAFLAIAFSPVILQVILGHGEFGAKSQVLTLGALDGLMCGIVCTSLTLSLLRVTQALGSLKYLPLVTGVSIVGNLLVSLGLSFVLGIAGIALGTSLMTMVTATLQVKLLEKDLGDNWSRTVMRSCLLPAMMVLIVGGGVAVLAYEGLVDTQGRILICFVGAAITILTQRLTQQQPCS
jgi:putative peptidoglycan lipid II flippase